MERYAVESTFAKSIGYDPSLQILEIETHGSATAHGHIYQYQKVSVYTYAALISAASIGKYYNRYIKNHFDMQEVYEQHLPDDVDSNLASKVAVAVVDEVLTRFGKLVSFLNLLEEE